MRSPSEMGIIEIDITNACVHSCSNCTRFCGHHKKPYFMSFDQFKEAVDSLDGFPGLVGIMGGEPTLHPEFHRFVEYLQSKRGSGNVKGARGPIKDMQLHIFANINTGYLHAETVLLSSLNSTYYKHFEIINDTFRYQILNDHDNMVEHQALLISRSDLGIPDEEWEKKRDSCWIQNTWSASITPKGAFFCEVAGAQDMLFDGPGGWNVEPGWWKRQPEDFGDQLKWCENCSGCLDAPKRLSNEDIDDVSPVMYEKLKAIDSPKLKKGNVVVRDPKRFDEYSTPSYINGTEYIVEKGNNKRMSDSNRVMFPSEVTVISSEKIERVIRDDNIKSWVMLDDYHTNQLDKWVKDYIWNPGCFYIIDKNVFFFNKTASAIANSNNNELNSINDIVSCYTKDKIVRLSSKDSLLSVIGGDSDYMNEGSGKRENKKLLVYGAGMVAKMVIDRLKIEGVNDFDVVVTSLEGNCTEICGHKVKELLDFADKSDDYLVLMCATPQIRRDMEFTLKDNGFKNYRAVV